VDEKNNTRAHTGNTRTRRASASKLSLSACAQAIAVVELFSGLGLRLHRNAETKRHASSPSAQTEGAIISDGNSWRIPGQSEMDTTHDGNTRATSFLISNLS
jgi:hypothetical protein